MDTKQDESQSKKQRYVAVSLILVIALGIFLRSYNFSDWLRFNSDQARDASIVRAMVEKNNWPLLGPVAGGTLFRLGPIVYYFQYVSASIFGTFPDRMAYPDLIFGIAAIPLTYLFFRKFFKKNHSLMLTGLYSVSWFTVQYSRFAWNPNSAQFFSLLFVYSLIKISDTQNRKKIIWIALAGLALGVAMQLHTLLLFGMPFALLIMAAYLIKKNHLNFANVIAIIIIAIMVNIAQVVSEVESGGANYLEFKKALADKSGSQGSFWKNTIHVISCQMQSNAKILAPYENQEECKSPFAEKYFKRISRRNENFFDWSVFAGKFAIAMIFSGLGYFLLFRSIKRENDKSRKKNLWLVALFNASLLAVFAPFGAEISLRYFILLPFVPFFLLGLCLKASFERYKLLYKALVFSIFALMLYNIAYCIKTFQKYANNIPGNMVDGDIKQIQKIANYVIEESGGSKKIHFGGQKVYLNRFVNRISYFVNKSEIEIIPLDKGITVDNSLIVFVAADNMSKKCDLGSAYKEFGIIDECNQFDGVTILKMRPGSR